MKPLLRICAGFFGTTGALALIVVLLGRISWASETLPVDQAGFEVKVPENPVRVVALAPSITEIVFALGEEKRLVGVTRFSDHPPETRNLPRVGTYVHLDLEKIVALDPDLCIAVKDGNPIDVVERLKHMAIPVYAVDPRSLESVMDAVTRVGRILGAQERGEALAADMGRRIRRVRDLTARAERAPRVFFQIGIDPIVSAGSGTFIDELIRTAGGVNLAGSGTGYPRYSREEVLALIPDVIIITSMTRGGRFETVKAEWEAWPHLPAVREGRVHVVDSNLFDRPTPRMVTALETLFRLLNPDLAERFP